MGGLAIDGGEPVRSETLPYARHTISEADEEAVLEALRSGWLTTGPRVERFEQAVAKRAGGEHGIAVSSGTAALHTTARVLGLGAGAEVIVPTMTFAATANAFLYEDARPVLVDVREDDLLLDPARVQEAITERTEAIVTVDYAGKPSAYPALRDLAEDHDLALVGDASHALGANLGDRPIGSLADVTTFSFHPAKLATSGEGGVLVTDDADRAAHARAFRRHAVRVDHHARAEQRSWVYEVDEIGWNYRLSDIHAALGLSQLSNLDGFIERRRAIAARYDAALSSIDGIAPLDPGDPACHAYHLYVVRVDEETFGADRDTVFDAMRAEGIGVNVHYIPLHRHPLYGRRLGSATDAFPRADAAFEQILTLPIFPAMTDEDIEDVLTALRKIASELPNGGARP